MHYLHIYCMHTWCIFVCCISYIFTNDRPASWSLPGADIAPPVLVETLWHHHPNQDVDAVPAPGMPPQMRIFDDFSKPTNAINRSFGTTSWIPFESCSFCWYLHVTFLPVLALTKLGSCEAYGFQCCWWKKPHQLINSLSKFECIKI